MASVRGSSTRRLCRRGRAGASGRVRQGLADPRGGTERGLTASEIVTYMNANFERAKGHRRRIDRNADERRMAGAAATSWARARARSATSAWPRSGRCSSERRLPDRINVRLAALRKPSRAPSYWARWQKRLGRRTRCCGAGRDRRISQPGRGDHSAARQFPAAFLAEQPPVKAARWLDQNWSTEDRHWFHHTSQGTATFPVPYSWFIALEQPGLHLFTRPGLLADPNYLDRFGFIPSPKSATVDAETLKRFGFVNSGAKTEPAPASVAGLKPTPVDNFDGLPVGFSRMSNVKIPAPALPESDRIGLTCAACHTGSIRYQDVSIRFDGGAAMLDLRKLEIATGLAIFYTLIVPGRFERFATACSARAPTRREGRAQEGLKEVADFLKNQVEITQEDAESQGPEGNRRRIWPARRAEPDRQPGLLCRFRGERSFRLRKTICMPTMRRSVSRRSGPCHGCGGRSMTLRSNSR